MKRAIAVVMVLCIVIAAVPGYAMAAPSGGGYGLGERIGRALLELIGAKQIVSDIHRQAAQNRPQTPQQQLAAARLAKAQADAAKARAQAEKAQLELERQRAKGQPAQPKTAKPQQISPPDRPLHLRPISLPMLAPITTVLPVAAGLWWWLTHPGPGRIH